MYPNKTVSAFQTNTLIVRADAKMLGGGSGLQF